MSEWWVRLFDLYLYNNSSIVDFLSWIDNEWKIITQKSLENIKLIAQNNYCLYSDLYDQRLIDDQKEFAQYVLANKGKYFSNFDYLYLTNDYYINKTLPGLCDSVNGRAILDCGAFMWDTAIPFAHMFHNSIIHAFEPESHNYQKLINVIKYNKLEKQIVPVELWVGDQNIITTISDWWAGAKIWEWTNQIKIVTIDSYSKENNLDVGLIKWDIEWFEYESVVGAEQTIKKYKPVLIISLYHRWKDFFEIKKLLESWDVWYKFTVRKWNCFHPFADTVLICY
jgi:FkbM family methyltransferase